MPLTIPFLLANAGLNTPTAQLDSDYAAIANWINARNPLTGPIASRPAAGNVGAIFVASDQGYQIYVDDGTTWHQTSVTGAANFFDFVKATTPPAPAATHSRLYSALTTPSGASERLNYIDGNGMIFVLPQGYARSQFLNVSNTTVETAILILTLKANFLNEIGRMSRVYWHGGYLNASGAPATLTFRVYYAGSIKGTMVLPAIASNSSVRGFQALSMFITTFAGAAGTMSVSSLATLLNPGSAGLSTGKFIEDYSFFASGGTDPSDDLTVDQTLQVSVQHSVASPNVGITVLTLADLI